MLKVAYLSTVSANASYVRNQLKDLAAIHDHFYKKFCTDKEDNDFWTLNILSKIVCELQPLSQRLKMDP